MIIACELVFCIDTASKDYVTIYTVKKHSWPRVYCWNVSTAIKSTSFRCFLFLQFKRHMLQFWMKCAWCMVLYVTLRITLSFWMEPSTESIRGNGQRMSHGPQYSTWSTPICGKFQPTAPWGPNWRLLFQFHSWQPVRMDLSPSAVTPRWLTTLCLGPLIGV